MKFKNLSEEDTIRRSRLIYSIYTGSNSKKTHRDIANSAGYSPEYLSRIISGNRRLTDEAAEQLASVLHVRKEYLLGEDEYMTEDDYKRAIDKHNELSKSIFNISQLHDNVVFSKHFQEYLEGSIDSNNTEKQDDTSIHFLIDARQKNIILDLKTEKYIELSDNEYFSLCEEIAQFIQFKINNLFKVKGNKFIPKKLSNSTL